MNVTEKVFQVIRQLDHPSAAYLYEILSLLGFEELDIKVFKRLLESKEFYDLSPAGFLSLNKRGDILDANLFVCTLLEAPHDHLVGGSLYPFVLREDRDVLYLHLRRLFKIEYAPSCELCVRSNHGLRYDVLMDSILVKDLEGRPVSRTVLSDITRFKALEGELRRSHDELEIRVKERTAELEARTRELEKEITKRERFEKALKGATEKIAGQLRQRKEQAGRLVELLERDRHETGMALHDGVGQILTVIKMEIEGMEEQLAMSPVLARVKMVKERVSEMIRLVRDISLSLRPAPLETLGLVPSIRSLIESLGERDGLKIELFEKELSGRFDPQKELALYRIAQESLTNALKHAQAGEIYVTLIRRNESISLTVEDDGRGFDAAGIDKLGPSRNGSLGLTIMRERALQFGGTFTVESKPGKGTQVMAEIPIGQQMEDMR